MKNQKMILPVIVLVLIIIGAGAFMMMRKNTPGSPLTNSIKNNILDKAKCMLGDADLCRYGQALIDGGYFNSGFSMKSVITDKDGKKTEGIYKMKGQKNFQMTSYDKGKEIANIILIDNIMYTKDYTDNQWMKFENKQDTSGQTDQYNPEKMKTDMKDLLAGEKSNFSYKKIGKEACAPFNCFKYQLMMTNLPDYTQYVYFDDQQYLMRKTTSQMKDGSMVEMTYDYKPVTISIPSPVKTADWQKYMQGPTGAITPDPKSMEDLQKQIEEQMKKSGN